MTKPTHLWSALALALSVTLSAGCGGGDETVDKDAKDPATKQGDPVAGTDPEQTDPKETEPKSTDPAPTDPTEPEPKPIPEGRPKLAAPGPEPEIKPIPTDDPLPLPKPEPETKPIPDDGPDKEVAAVAPGDAPANGKVTGDWPMWGGDASRNMVNATTGIATDFAPDGNRQLWKQPAGSQAYANPVVADGRVYVGANNGSAYRKQYDQETDLGVVLCFDEKTGEFLWQLSRTKLAAGRVNDWPEQGICSTPCIEGEHLYVVTNRGELMCLDTKGFRDDENDGFSEEAEKEQEDADVVWSLDMIEDLGVFPHNLATSSPVLYGDNVYVITSNGVGEEHLDVPAPRAPCFIAVNKVSGELVWEDNTPFDGILHGQWSSPTVAEVDGKAQILMAGGDGWLYAFDPAGDGDGGGKILWKFDLNPKDTRWLLGGEGTRNNIIATPVVVGNSVILAVGQDPEHGNGVGHLYRIALDKQGDVSPVIVVDKESGEPVEHGVIYDGGEAHEIKPNENSAQIWHFGGIDEDGSVTGKKDAMIYRRTISTVAVDEGLVYAADLMGYLHCLDLEQGTRYWEYDTFGEIWGSPMVADGKVFLGDAEGDLTIFETGKGKEGKPTVLETIAFPNAIYSTPTIANGNVYMTDRNTLYAFDVTGSGKAAGDKPAPAGAE
jgi:outer membrane protein assembly factor BamB